MRTSAAAREAAAIAHEVETQRTRAPRACNLADDIAYLLTSPAAYTLSAEEYEALLMTQLQCGQAGRPGRGDITANDEAFWRMKLGTYRARVKE